MENDSRDRPVDGDERLRVAPRVSSQMLWTPPDSQTEHGERFPPDLLKADMLRRSASLSTPRSCRAHRAGWHDRH